MGAQIRSKRRDFVTLLDGAAAAGLAARAQQPGDAGDRVPDATARHGAAAALRLGQKQNALAEGPHWGVIAMLKKLVIVTSGLMLVVNIDYSAHAQVSKNMNIDISKVTCEQIYKSTIEDARYVGFWLSGFYHGKRNDTVLDVKALKSNAKELTTYCVRNPQTLVMDAVESVFGEKKKK